MSNNSSNGVTSADHLVSTEQICYIINGVLAWTLTIPAIALNISIIKQYRTLPTDERKRGTKYLILQQAIVDLYNGLVPSPLLATGNIVYYTNVFQRVSDKQKGFYQYWYITCSWTMLVSLLCNLSFFILLASDRLMAVWKPVYWHSHLKYGQTRYMHVGRTIWICSGVFAVGEVYGHSVQFLQNGGIEAANQAHLARTTLCLFLTGVLVVIWSMTFFKTFSYHDRRRKLSMQQKLLVVGSTSKIRTGTQTSQDSATVTEATPIRNTRLHANTSESNFLLRLASSSPSAVYSSELKLIRVFATMFAFFLVGYVPILVYLTMRSIDSTRMSSSTENNHELHMVNATACTALVLASCLNPCLVMLHVDHFQFLCAKEDRLKRIKGRNCSSFRTEMISSIEQRKISENVNLYR